MTTRIIDRQHEGPPALIEDVIEARRLAWNDADTQRYGTLLTDDCDIVSATGRASKSRQAVIDLYVQQRGLPVYAKAIVTASQIQAIRMLTEGVALVDVQYRMTHVRWNGDDAMFNLEGNMLFVMQRETTWKIASMRAQPPQVTPMT
ncbi:MAG: SgcJ/EcaC family oxidoreductase [Alcaligenaceae bacterium]|nr:MAG: SgcJ/EcaC family oxidoreductase [Alcaligenaceae bacterium]